MHAGEAQHRTVGRIVGKLVPLLVERLSRGDTVASHKGSVSLGLEAHLPGTALCARA